MWIVQIEVRSFLFDHLADVPVKGFDARFRLQVQKAELEHFLGLFLDLNEIVPRLVEVSGRQLPLDLEKLRNELVIDGTKGTSIKRGLLDRAERLDDQYGVMSDDSSSRFRNESRLRNSF